MPLPRFQRFAPLLLGVIRCTLCSTSPTPSLKSFLLRWAHDTTAVARQALFLVAVADGATLCVRAYVCPSSQRCREPERTNNLKNTAMAWLIRREQPNNYTHANAMVYTWYCNR